jgi:ABC-type thiamine transport system ATPase subunit
MSELVLQGVVEGPLFGVNARLGGSAVVLGSDPAALATLVAVAAGVRAPRRGHALLDGRVLHASPELRRATAALLAEESLPALARVNDAVEAMLAARGDRKSARAWLEEAGLADFGARPARDLDASERRTLLLALALTHPGPRLVVLYEPLAVGRGLGEDFVRNGIARCLGTGATVVVATLSLDDARALGGDPWLLHRGVLTNVPNLPLGAPPAADQAFVVETPDARRLTAALARDPAIRGVRWNEELAPDTVLVFGSDTERLASAVVRVLAEESLRVQSLGLAPAPVESLVAAAAPAPQAYPFAAPPGTQPYAPQVAFGASPPVAPGPTASTPPDQSVSMPSTFADPTRPPGGGA